MAVNNSGRQEGMVFEQLYEAGPVWERLVDHPAWSGRSRTSSASDDPENFDNHHGLLFIDECFGTIRRRGGAQRMHSGGHVGTIRTQYRYHAGRFHCGQVNILMALTDIGPGDGATMVVPGSHKSNIRHPQTVPLDKRGEDVSIDGIGGRDRVPSRTRAMRCCSSMPSRTARRAAPIQGGERRVAVYRYGPSWGYFRLPYRPSPELLDRLTPERRAVVQPHDEVIAPPMPPL